MSVRINELIIFNRIQELVADGYLLKAKGSEPLNSFSVTKKGLAVLMASCDRPLPKPKGKLDAN